MFFIKEYCRNFNGTTGIFAKIWPVIIKRPWSSWLRHPFVHSQTCTDGPECCSPSGLRRHSPTIRSHGCSKQVSVTNAAFRVTNNLNWITQPYASSWQWVCPRKVIKRYHNCALCVSPVLSRWWNNQMSSEQGNPSIFKNLLKTHLLIVRLG